METVMLSERGQRCEVAERGMRIWRRVYILSLVCIVVLGFLTGYAFLSENLLFKVLTVLGGLASVIFSGLCRMMVRMYDAELMGLELQASAALVFGAGRGKARRKGDDQGPVQEATEQARPRKGKKAPGT